MASKNYTLTLTRWHHVASRLKALSKAHLDEARSILSNTRTDTAPSVGQIQALEARGARGLELLASGRAAVDAVGKIRTAMARANAEAHITEQLSQVEHKRALARVLADFGSIDLITATPPEMAEQVLAARAVNNTGRRGFMDEPGILLAVVDPTVLEGLREEQAALEAEAAALTDKVADSNRAEMSVELDESLAKAVGL
jgi:hypothetical protein